MLNTKNGGEAQDFFTVQYVTNKVDTVRLKQHFQFKVQLSGVPYLLF